MSIGLRLIGALVVTYLLSRGLIRVLGAQTSRVRLVLAHALSLLILAVTLGFVRAYWIEFEWRAAFIYVGPQLVWLIFDYARQARR